MLIIQTQIILIIMMIKIMLIIMIREVEVWVEEV